MIAYKADSGRMFVYLNRYPSNGELLYSEDGKLFYAMAVLGFGGTRDGHSISFQNPHHDQPPRKLALVEGNVIYNEEVYKPDESFKLDEVGIVKLPKSRRLEYVFESIEDPSTKILVTSSVYHFAYEGEDGFKLYIGKEWNNLTEIPIKGANRARDGGTTDIVTVEDTLLHSPTPFKPDEAATYMGIPLTSLNKAEFSPLLTQYK